MIVETITPETSLNQYYLATLKVLYLRSAENDFLAIPLLAAEAEAQAIQKVIDAIRDNGQPDKYLIAMKYLETLKEMMTGQDNKVVYMPYEATGVLSSLDGIKQMLDAGK